MTIHTTKLRQQLFEEIRGRIKQTDSSVPYKLDGYVYYTRHENDQAYPIYCRRPGSMDGEEQIMLDVNRLAEGFEFYELTDFEVSFGQNLLAYAFDTEGRSISTIRFQDLDTGKILEDEIRHVTGNMAWANDNQSLFYTRQNPETLRACRLFKHLVGTDAQSDPLIFEETDETFAVSVSKSKSKRYLFLSSHQTLSSEYRYLEAETPDGQFRIFQTRQADHEYQVDHCGDDFLIRTNSRARNFRLMKTPLEKTGRRHWQEVVPHQEDVLLADFEIFEDFLVLAERGNGLTRLRVRPLDGRPEHYLNFDEPAYAARIGTNPEFKTRLLRYVYSSLTTPRSTFDYDMSERKKTRLKEQEVLGGFDARNYSSERHYARAGDGAEIPISLVYRKSTRLDGSAPLLLYGYGSYGISVDAAVWPSAIEPARSGFCVRYCPRAGGTGERTGLVRRRQASAQEKHFYRLRGLRGIPGGSKACGPGPPLCSGRQCRRLIDRRGHELAAGSL